MLLSPGCSDWLARCLVVASAISGSDRYPGQPVFWQQKAQALARLARSGDGRDCDAVLKAMRGRRAWAETNLKLNREAEKQLLDGIANDLEIIKITRTDRDKASRMRDLESHTQTLSICKDQQELARKIIANLLWEERAFEQACRLLRAQRPAP
jgi:hypothetical protein